MKRIISAGQAVFALAILLGLQGCGSNRGTDWQPSATPTFEDVLRTATYVGAEVCAGCHVDNHSGWAATAHQQILRDGAVETSYVNDGDASGRADFFDGAVMDLATAAAGIDSFAGFGTNAPQLGSDAAGPFIKIGTSTYYIAYTLGGSAHQNRTAADANADGLILNSEAQWKQLYVTRVGNSNYILPVQFNAATSKYVVFDTDDWYDASNAPQQVAASRSYERRCAGCHVTGLEISVTGSEWSMAFTDSSVACEACHGPGGRHVINPELGNIVNPATMIADEDLNGDDVVDGLDDLVVRNMVCNQCHARGLGLFADDDGEKTGYPSRIGADGAPLLYMPGLDWRTYFVVTTDEADYWGGVAATSSGDFIGAKTNHQQQQDLAAGQHGLGDEDGLCFSCHDMHSATRLHMVASSISAGGVEVATDNDNNTLCLACHAGQGDFASLTPELVNANDSAVIGPVVQAHMGSVAMGGVVYDPTGVTMAGRCSGCHMPATGESAGRDANNLGDIHSHTLRVIWPSRNEKDSALAALPNGCNGCHNDGGVVAGTDQITAWAKSGHGDENSDAWTAYDWDGLDSDPQASDYQECQRCHTASGAEAYMADPATYAPANNEFNLHGGENQVLYCFGCHSGGTGGALNSPGAITADYADASQVFADILGSNVCLACHIGRESGGSIKNSSADFSALGLIDSHYLSGGAMVLTAGGYEYDGQDYTNPGAYAHDQVGLGTVGPCIGCHLSAPEPDSHLFQPVSKDADTGEITAVTATVCAGCHAFGAADLVTESDGLNALLEALRSRLSEAGFVYALNYPYFFNSVDNSYENRVIDWVKSGDVAAGKNNMGAAFNYIMVLQDLGAYTHNSYYAKRLVFDAIDWLDNSLFDGTIDLSVYPAAAAYIDGDADPANDNTVARP